MKIKFVLLLAGVVVVAGVYVAFNLKQEEVTVSAHYEMLACENCFHMTIQKSTNNSLVGETIIPISGKIDIEQMIDSVALSKNPLCLKGRLYRFNLNVLGISPSGKRFEVREILKPEICGDN